MSSVEYDPLTGLPRKKKQAASLGAADPWMIAAGLAPTESGATNTLSTGAPPGPPDYAGLINADPTYAQAKLDFGAQGVSDAASRAAQTQRALTLFGEVPDFGSLGLNADWIKQDVTDTTRQLAKKNTDAGLSLAARRDKMFKDNLHDIKGSLAARGALRSGETGHALQGAQSGYDQSRFDATNTLVEFLSGLQAGFAERQRQGQRDLAERAREAEARVRAANPYTPPAAAQPPLVPPAPPPAAPPNYGPQDPWQRNLPKKKNLLDEAMKRYAGL